MKQDWEIKKLGEVCKLTNGYAFQSKEYTDDGYFVIRIGNVQDGYIELNNPRYIKLSEEKQKKFILSEGDILVSLTGNVGRVGEIKEEHLPAVLNQRVAKISLNSKSLQKAYLFYFLTSEYFITELIKAGRGAAQQNISTTDIENLIIPLPSLPEQQRIVSILDEAFAAIAKAKTNAEQNLKNAKELFESYLQGVFEKKGDGWEVKKLGEIVKYDKKQNIHKGLPYVGLEHIESSSGSFLGSIEPQEVKSSTFHFDEQHVLYGRLRPYLNKVLLPNFEGHCSTEIFPIKVNKQVVREFLFYWLIAGSTVKKIDATWTGARMPRANMNQVLEFDFALPSIKEQQTIVQKLNALRTETQKLESVYQKKIDDLEELKKSILQKAFAGELKTEKAVAI